MLPKKGVQQGGGTSLPLFEVSAGLSGSCFTEHTVWVQHLEGSVCVARPCLCGGKMLQLGVSVYLLGFFSVKPNAGIVGSPPS